MLITDEKGMIELALEEGFKKGFAEGFAQGIEKGIEQRIEKGKEEKSIDIARKLFKKSFSIEEVSELTGLSLEDLRRLEKC